MAALNGGGNVLFPIARNGFLVGTFDWDSDTWYIFLVDHGVDIPDDADDYADDITSRINSGTESANRIASPVATDGDGVADGNDVTMTSVSGNESESLVIAREIGGDQTTPANDEVIAYIEDANGTLPVTPNGGDIEVQWDSGANKIFKL